jgi:hypothetical protein
MESRFRNGMSVGMNVYCLEWDELIRYVKEVGNCVVAGDYTAFDTQCQPQFMRGFAKAANAYYNDSQELQTARLVFIEQIINSTGVFADCMLTEFLGDPSGCNLTSIINCFVNICNLCYAWLNWMTRNWPELADLSEMDRLTRYVTYGDDFWWSICPEVAEHFGLPQVIAEVLKIGMIMTPEDKSDVVLQYKRAEDSTFLKQKPVMRDGLYYPLKAREEIEEMSNWVTVSPNLVSMTFDKCTDMLKLAAYHGPEYYNTLRDVTTRALELVGCDQVLPTFEYHENMHRRNWYGNSLDQIRTDRFSAVTDH